MQEVDGRDEISLAVAVDEDKGAVGSGDTQAQLCGGPVCERDVSASVAVLTSPNPQITEASTGKRFKTYIRSF